MTKKNEFNDCDILFVLGNLSIGGVEKTNISLANHLAKNYKKKISIVVLTNINPQLKSLVSKELNLIIFDKTRISQSIFLFLDLIKKIKPKVIFSSMDYINVFTIILTKISLIKTKIIISERIDQAENIKRLNGIKQRMVYVLFKLIIFRLYNNADLIHCISNGVKNSLYKIFGINKKIKVIYNPLNLTPIKKNRKIDNKIIKKKKYRFNLLTVGRLEKQKNLTCLLKALTIVKSKINFHLNIVGEGSELKNLINLTKKLELSKNVTFVGKVIDPRRFYEKADIFILSSNFEGFGNVIIEALAFNCKVISSDCPSGPKEILENGKWGKLFPVNNHQKLANLILDISQKKIFQNSSIRAQKFSIQKIGFEYKKMFDEVLKK